jgi:hypothetical protein
LATAPMPNPWRPSAQHLREPARGSGSASRSLRRLATFSQPIGLCSRGWRVGGLHRSVVGVPLAEAMASYPRSMRTWPSPLLAASSRGLTGRVGTSTASPSWKPRWEASGLSCSQRSRAGSIGSPLCSILTPPPYRLTCPHLRRRPVAQDRASHCARS